MDSVRSRSPRAHKVCLARRATGVSVFDLAGLRAVKSMLGAEDWRLLIINQILKWYAHCCVMWVSDLPPIVARHSRMAAWRSAHRQPRSSSVNSAAEAVRETFREVGCGISLLIDALS